MTLSSNEMKSMRWHAKLKPYDFQTKEPGSPPIIDKTRKPFSGLTNWHSEVTSVK